MIWLLIVVIIIIILIVTIKVNKQRKATIRPEIKDRNAFHKLIHTTRDYLELDKGEICECVKEQYQYKVKVRDNCWGLFDDFIKVIPFIIKKNNKYEIKYIENEIIDFSSKYDKYKYMDKIIDILTKMDTIRKNIRVSGIQLDKIEEDLYSIIKTSMYKTDKGEYKIPEENLKEISSLVDKYNEYLDKVAESIKNQEEIDETKISEINSKYIKKHGDMIDSWIKDLEEGKFV